MVLVSFTGWVYTGILCFIGCYVYISIIAIIIYLSVCTYVEHRFKVYKSTHSEVYQEWEDLLIEERKKFRRYVFSFKKPKERV